MKPLYDLTTDIVEPISLISEQLGQNPFTRKDYMLVFKTISSATASRDLKKGLELKLRGEGKGNQMKYYFQQLGKK